MSEELANNLFQQAEAARARGDVKSEIALLSGCIRENPAASGAWFNLANTWARTGQRDGAVAIFHKLAADGPEDYRVLTNLGWHLQELGRSEEAALYLRRATDLAPNAALGWSNLCLAETENGRLSEAIIAGRRAVELDPNEPRYQLALSFALMNDGRWNEGLRYYEARFPLKMPEFLSYPMPRWDGGRIERLLIVGEQGMGDVLQFARYIRLAAAKVGYVIAAIREELRVPVEDGTGRLENVGFVSLPAAVPEADAFCPIMSLPLVLGLTDAEIPKTPPLDLTDDFRAENPGGIDVGIVWAGSPDQDNDANRSASIEDFLGLTEAPGVRLHSFQVGDRAREARPYAPLVIDETRTLWSYGDTQERLHSVDVVVTVCTSMAHLAGSMGIPTYVLLPKRGQHFIWGRGVESTPWYPSVTLYRQYRPGDWSTCISRVVTDLKRRSGK